MTTPGRARPRWTGSDLSNIAAPTLQPGDGRTETIAAGLLNREIAERLYLSSRTMERHVTSLLRRTGAPNRAALATVISPTGGTQPVN